jgi:putative Holliday junction resolvase
LARILSIDYGQKRCGIAVTDPLQIIVNGLTAVSQPELLNFVINYCTENQVEKIVIGYPLQADGTKTKISLDIEVFKMKLESKLMQIKIELIDEYKSSQHALQVMVQSGIPKKKRRDKSLLDKMSAVIILQKYLGHI